MWLYFFRLIKPLKKILFNRRKYLCLLFFVWLWSMSLLELIEWVYSNKLYLPTARSVYGLWKRTFKGFKPKTFYLYSVSFWLEHGLGHQLCWLSFFMFSLRYSRRIQPHYFKSATTASFHIISNLFLRYHFATVRRCTVEAINSIV
jgi:hypothetical protein